MYVQFSDSKETEIVAWFGAQQDPEEYPNQGTVEENDSRYADYYNSLPEVLKEGMPMPKE